MNYWLVKTEPEEFSIEDLRKSGSTLWTGVRNYGARNNLRAMQKGDLVLIHHTGKNPSIVGIGEVSEVAVPEKKGSIWYAPRIRFVSILKKPVTLSLIRSNKLFKNLPLVRQPRLSVQSVPKHLFKKLSAKKKTAS